MQKLLDEHFCALDSFLTAHLLQEIELEKPPRTSVPLSKMKSDSLKQEVSEFGLSIYFFSLVGFGLMEDLKLI